jgi:hypothetical protein
MIKIGSCQRAQPTMESPKHCIDEIINTRGLGRNNHTKPHDRREHYKSRPWPGRNHANTDEADETAATAGTSATAEPSLTADGPAATGDPRWPRDLLLRMRAAALRSNASAERRDWLPKSIINDI